MDGARSALVRRAADQLKPSPRGRHDLSDLSFLSLFVLIPAAVEEGEDEDKEEEGSSLAYVELVDDTG